MFLSWRLVCPVPAGAVALVGYHSLHHRWVCARHAHRPAALVVWALRRLLDCLHWFPFDGSSPPRPDWNETVEGGKLRMQDAGLAEGDRTLSDMIKFDD